MKQINVLTGRAGAYFIILIWQRLLGRYVNRMLGIRCRFFPSCSEYAVIALRKHGFIRGIELAWNRLKRCRPDNFETSFDLP